MKLKIIAATVFILASHTTRAESKANFVAHEWGTFTSVQGGDGELLPWCPLKASELPGFVHNLSKPGLNRIPTSMFVFKGQMITLQRLETPVVYFYSGENMSVDVSVGFPKGLITEWYPQASQIGPSIPADTNTANGALAQSRAVWKNLQIAATSKSNSSLKDMLPQDKSGGHYFAARETGASMVRQDFTDQTNNVSEAEKFIFYRGAGSFKTPLRVGVDANSAVTVENTGTEKLGHLFLIQVVNAGAHGGEPHGWIASRNGLPAKSSAKWQKLAATDEWKYSPLAEFQTNIAAQMEAALTSEGLFPDEARAMVNTWKDSWFSEDGVRVLYILPRAWTDETLPMTLNPKPEKLVRVMVGRAEVIAPSVEMGLFQVLTKAQNGDADARHFAAADLKQLGRFAEPALQLANHHASRTNVLNLGYQLLYSAPSKFE